MNYHNFDRLVAYLQDLIVIGPETFNYMNGYELVPGLGGCLDCHCRVLMGAPAFIGSYGTAIRAWLNISPKEAHDLWSPALHHSSTFGFYLTDDEHAGVPGIREALRRLAILATRYERPKAAEPVKADPMPSSLRATLDAISRGEQVTS